MRLRNIPGSREALEKSRFVIEGPCGKEQAAEEDLRGTRSPLRVEIGMGKGRFIMEQARLHPEINFIGIEKYSSVLLRAVQKQEAEQLPNLMFIRMEAEYVEEVFAPGSVQIIYLNFSDPWPKEKNAKRRLTSRQFLKRYENILADGGLVEFKTDNTALFDFSVEEASVSGWEIIALTRDLHNDPMSEGNIMTEYEEKFSAQGNKICKFIIKPPARSRLCI